MQPAPMSPCPPTDHGVAIFGDGAPPDAATPWRGTFVAPRAIWQATDLDQVGPLVARVQAEADAGRWVVLVLAYEAAPAFDPALAVRGAPDAVLAWAASYDGPVPPLNHAPHPPPHVAAVPDWVATVDGPAFAARMATLLGHIAAGDTYQVNATFALQAPLAVDAAWTWYADARRRAQVPYAAWIARSEDLVLSLSPELFVERQGRRVVTRPMKGTASRGRWGDEDRDARDRLLTSEKARAENVMIVDLLRNDLGRLATPGTVRVTDLCRAEPYPTVWQLTSTIEAEVPENVSLWSLLQALFPCGSVTGAPKVRTMAIIAATESTPRGVYTGTIGLVRPGGDAVFSVPIRTAVIDRGTGQATLGVGAGITADSDPSDEYAECLLKARVARHDPAHDVHGLFETLRLEAGVYWLRDRHLVRLRESAARLGIPCDVADLERALFDVAAAHPAGLWRVRLVVPVDGPTACHATAHADSVGQVWRVGFASTPVDPRDLRLFHKTLDRSLYEAARRERPDLDEVLLWTAEGHVTESTLANLVVALEGRRWTPPVSSGLLAGTYRAELLARGGIAERVLTREDVCRADRVWLVNSLRGWLDAQVVDR